MNHIPDSDPYILASLLGFAAPLMALTEYSGVLYNIVGHSAAGKSTALKLMTSVWGEPNPEHILVNDTDNAIYNHIGYLSSIPVAFDEVTNMDPLRLSSFLLSFTGGRGKMRATRDGQNRTNEVFWDTIICSTSNSWLYTKLMEARQGYNAEQTRVFELEVHPSQDAYRQTIDNAIRKVNDNYGMAGREYLEYIIPRVGQIKPMLDKAHATVMNMGLRNHERFWGALLACVLVGARIAREKLHLHEYDEVALIHRLITGVDKVRTNMASSASDPVSVMAEFINTNLNATLRFKDGQLDVAAFSNALNSVKIRMEAENGQIKTAFISAQAIKEYCSLRKIDYGWLRRELTETGILVNANLPKRLTSGSPLPTMNGKCWQLDMTHAKIAGAIDLDIPA
jgi:energy-coupling factor transporter ATP-binding protein EcfA2